MKKWGILIMMLCCCNVIFAQQRPVIFVHGMLGSGDTWARTLQYFLAAGYNENDILVLDWNSTAMNNRAGIQKLDSMITDALSKSGSSKVDLVGHSAGGGLCYSYLKDTLQAGKVAHYVHLASSKITKPAIVPTLNLYSVSDQILGGADCPGAVNINFPGKDHYEIATCRESAEAMFSFFNGKNATDKNELTRTKKKNEYVISGKVCSMGDNIADGGAQVTVYEINAVSGERNAKVFDNKTDMNGLWGPLKAKNGMYYEFVVKSANSKTRTVHYFMEPFAFNDKLVYLRTLPRSGMAAMMLSSLPEDARQCVLAVFKSNSAMIAGRDSVTVENTVLTTEELSSERKTAIAHFIYDDGDNNTSGKPLPTFKMMPFMSGADVFLSALETKPVTIFFNNKVVKYPRVNSAEGIMVAVFK